MASLSVACVRAKSPKLGETRLKSFSSSTTRQLGVASCRFIGLSKNSSNIQLCIFSTSVFYLENVSVIIQLGLYYNLGSFFKASKKAK
jgi:hypothetical protein